MRSFLKLMPLAIVAALAIVLAARAGSAGATPSSLTVNGSTSASTVTLSTAVPVVATYTDEGADLTLYSTAATSIGYFLSGPSITTNNDGQTLTPNATPATSITATDDTDTTAETTVLQAFFYCVSSGTTQIYFTQGGGASSQITVTCGSGSTTTLSVSPTSTTVGAAATVTGNCTAASQTLTASTGGYFSSAPTNGSYVSATQVNCAAAGSVVATFYCSSTATVTFTLNGAVGYLYCGSSSSGVTVSPSSTAVGSASTVTGTCTAAGQTLVAGTGGYFSSAVSNGTYVSATQINCVAAGSVVATFYCSSTATVTFSLNGAVGYLYCGTSGSGVTVSPSSTAVGSASTVTGTCTAAGQTLIASTGGYFTSAASNGTYVSATQINCVAAGSVVATFYCSSTDAAWVAAAIFLGDSVRSRRAYALEAERGREEEGRRRASEQRLQIAQELHDVVGHNVSLITVQAGAGLHVLYNDPTRAKEAFANIRRASHETMQELRSMVGVLRDPVTGVQQTMPIQRLDAFDSLIKALTDAGQQVELSISGRRPDIPSVVDVSAYRILQEALTNAVRHAPRSRVHVAIDYAPDSVSLEVTNTRAAQPAQDSAGGGHGLVGMRERVAAIGGRIEIGPQADGGFRVKAVLPID